MGKAYAKELAGLGETYAWALGAPIKPLQDFLAHAHGRPMLAVGSGGSATAAHIAALLHRLEAGAFARHTTPLELVLSEPNLSEAAVLFLSASGKNRDVLSAVEHSLSLDPRTVAAICTQRDSPLAQAIRGFDRGHVFEEAVPSGKDGFLATNSLLATCVVIARTYGHVLPKDFSIATDGEPAGLEDRRTVLILHGGWGSPIATDLESKLNESAIASAQVSDYRNFGHGRHFWLARRGTDTAVILIVNPETRDLAERTRALLPEEVSIIEMSTKQLGAAGTIDLLIQAFRLVGRLGELQSFDPGRPVVPDFGRKLYHLALHIPRDRSPIPVLRKQAKLRAFCGAEQTRVLRAFDSFVARFERTTIGGIVLDYDGTLCGPAERFGALRQDIGRECRRILEGGLQLGIATGRGRSVRTALQSTLPKSLWDRVIVGYYNGGEIAPLGDDSAPSRDKPPAPPLDAALKLLEDDPLLRELVSLTARLHQITVEPKQRVSTDSLIAHVMTVVAPLEDRGVHVLTSSHSVDVLAPGVGKLAVLDSILRRTPADHEVLCIGDRGAWPGNDAALLSHLPALSVDEVSASLTTCWNIAPPGVTGADGTLHYLRALHFSNGVATLRARGLWEIS
jgi:DNA-binding MurR/RpiR family transcriptional regulator/phosphoglycolate phosphatase-like HAD superfamily hydrolase